MSDVGYYNFNDKGWYYRDWVINALNQDMGYDDFIVHQIAGDLLPSSDPPKPYLAGMIATRVLAMGNLMIRTLTKNDSMRKLSTIKSI